MENQNNITIGDLARIVQKGFEETAKKDEVNTRFDKVEDRLETIEKLLIKRTFSCKVVCLDF